MLSMYVVREQLKEYLEILEKEDKQFREKYKGKCKDSNCFTYDREKMKQMTTQEHMRIRNISEQKLHIRKLLRLMGEK